MHPRIHSHENAVTNREEAAEEGVDVGGVAGGGETVGGVKS